MVRVQFCILNLKKQKGWKENKANDNKINHFKIQRNLLNLSEKVLDIAKLQKLKIICRKSDNS